MKELFNQDYYNRYINGETLWDISKKENKSYKKIFEAVFNHRFEAKLLSDLEKDYICDNYLKGISSVKLAERYGVNHHVIATILKERGIQRNRTLSTRKYSVDEHYFDVIDTSEKAYVLGLLYADGCNFEPKLTISISLQEEDVELLEKLRKELKSEKPLEFLDYSKKHDFGYTYKNQYRLLIFSKHMSKELHNKGVVTNKSLILEFPDWLDPDLYSHFIRGYFDGDGSIGKHNNTISCTITSTNNFCERIKKICENFIGVKVKIYDASCHNGVTKQMNIYGGKNSIKKFLDWIYTDANIYMERKYKRYMKYFYMDNSLSA